MCFSILNACTKSYRKYLYGKYLNVKTFQYSVVTLTYFRRMHYWTSGYIRYERWIQRDIFADQ